MRKSGFSESYTQVRGEMGGSGLQRRFLTHTQCPETSEKGSRKALPALSLISLTHDVILEVG